jgi:hypothetical protein
MRERPRRCINFQSHFTTTLSPVFAAIGGNIQEGS